MSDPIADILVGHCFMPPDHDDEPADIEIAMAEQVAKQIRQQIGRELLSKADLLGDKEGVYTAVKTLDIREVCKLEEE